MADFREQDRGFRRRPKILEYLGAGGMPEEEARELAEDLVRRARAETGRFTEGPAPSPDEVREHREVRQHTSA